MVLASRSDFCEFGADQRVSLTARTSRDMLSNCSLQDSASMGVHKVLQARRMYRVPKVRTHDPNSYSQGALRCYESKNVWMMREVESCSYIQGAK